MEVRVFECIDRYCTCICRCEGIAVDRDNSLGMRVSLP